MKKAVFICMCGMLLIASCTLFSPAKDPNTILDWITVPKVGTYYKIEDFADEQTTDTTTIKFVNLYEDSAIIVLTCENTSTCDTIPDTTYLVINLIGQFVDYLTFYPLDNIGFSCLLVCPVEEGNHWEYGNMWFQTECEIKNIDTTCNLKIGEVRTVKIRETGTGVDEIGPHYVDKYFSTDLCWNVYEKYDYGYEKRIVEKGSWK